MTIPFAMHYRYIQLLCHESTRCTDIYSTDQTVNTVLGNISTVVFNHTHSKMTVFEDFHLTVVEWDEFLP